MSSHRLVILILITRQLKTDLFWAERVSTLTEVRTDGRERHDVTLHSHLLTALIEHLLKDTRVETGENK